MKTVGIVPARMGSSRFPGKPLHPIAGKPMIEHVFARARLSWDWDVLCIATCDDEIREFAESAGFPVVMTSDTIPAPWIESPRRTSSLPGRKTTTSWSACRATNRFWPPT